MRRKTNLIRVSNDLYNYLKDNSVKNDSSFRVESKKMFNKYNEMKTNENKLRGKRLFVIGK